MKIFMYLNIPWNFIKQRPQFMAQELGRIMSLVVYYNKPYKKIYTIDSSIKPRGIQLVSKVKIPRKNRLFGKLDNLLQRLIIRSYIEKCELIWIMHPEQYEIIKPLIGKKKIIYDCMDDYSSFPHLSKIERESIKENEYELIKRANYIFYTAKTLQHIHHKRYQIDKKSFVINNALESVDRVDEDESIKKYLMSIKNRKIVYIGAISTWFDFEGIEQMLKDNIDVSVILFGPLDTLLPSNERIYYYGKVPHHSIYTAIKYADILIMPFEVNDLILSVDPIKVYEYIASGKPVIVPDYPEMDKFKPFVISYRSKEELSHLVSSIDWTCNSECVNEFINQNTWEVRAKKVASILENEK